MDKLIESTKLGAKKDGRTWRCRLISAGQGSSAYYPAEALEEYGPKALPKGTHIYLNHPTESEEWERAGARDIRDFAGVLMEDAQYVGEDEALYANVKFNQTVAGLVEEAYEDIALSIDIRKFELTENEEGIPVVEKLDYSPLNNVAVVPKGGRDGKIISLVESYREKIEDKPERKPMTEAEIKALAEALVQVLTPALKEALTPEAPEETPDLVGALEEAFAADLPAGARKRVAAAAEAGEDYKALIESEKADIEAIREGALKEAAQEGVFGSTTDLNKEFESLSIFGGDK